MTFATAFRHLRIQSNLSQKDIAKICGHNSFQTISNAERGKAYLPKKQLKKLCKRFKWDYDKLAVLIIKEKSDKIAMEWLDNDNL